MTKSDVENRWKELADQLISNFDEDGLLRGELSSSALATAVSVVALRLEDQEESPERIDRGLAWLLRTMNTDGGFGDSPGSRSNVSTSLLCYAAFSFCAGNREEVTECLRKIESYLQSEGVQMNPSALVGSILGFYGKDYTFSIPILSMVVICGVLAQEALEKIPRLPFELALLPPGLYRFFQLQVVSYAIPALVAVGIYLHLHKKKSFPLSGFARDRAVQPAIEKLVGMMPESGGFLEAVPLTAFVSMCLIRSGFSRHGVVQNGMKFINRLQRADGSWPIDTDLSNWVTTLAVKSLGTRLSSLLTEKQKNRICSHLLNSQYQHTHPFNQAGRGGWGWTSFSGSVPDADDTAGAVLALLLLDRSEPRVRKAVTDGCLWLADLQNKDGGIPTFCRGWGRLPFDKSCADLTGHAVLAWIKAGERYPDLRFGKSIWNALRYLERHQRPDGSWIPLWFGNQDVKGQSNPVYGTARVMTYLIDALDGTLLEESLRKSIFSLTVRAESFLLAQQNQDGSWGGERGVPGSIEETSLAVSALAVSAPASCIRGWQWLEREYQEQGLIAKPIGLYFASLWYWEKLYPLIFYLEASGRMLTK